MGEEGDKMRREMRKEGSIKKKGREKEEKEEETDLGLPARREVCMSLPPWSRLHTLVSSPVKLLLIAVLCCCTVLQTFAVLHTEALLDNLTIVQADNLLSLKLSKS